MQKTINIFGVKYDIIKWEKSDINEYGIKARIKIDGSEAWASDIFNYIKIDDIIIYNNSTHKITGYAIQYYNLLLTIENISSKYYTYINPMYLDQIDIIRKSRISKIKEII